MTIEDGSAWLYHYKALVTAVYDGDTITVDIDLGLGVFKRGEKIRLYGIDTPELRGSEEEKVKGRAARDYLRSQILNREVYLETYKDKSGKYGRLLGTVHIFYQGITGSINVNEMLVTSGHAKRYMV